MKKLFLVPTILSFAAIALAGQADARPGGCIKGAIVGGIVGHFVGHGGVGRPLAVPMEYTGGTATSEGRSSYQRRGGDGHRNSNDRY